MDPTNLGQRQLLGFGRMTGAGVNTWRTGSVIPLRTGAGVYTLTGPAGTVAAQVAVVVSQQTSGASPTVTYADTGGVAVATVNTFAVDGTTATNKDFAWEFWNVIPGAFTVG